MRDGIAPVKPVRQKFFRPDVLANRDADIFPRDAHGSRPSRRLEVARLVEHVVSRQQGFADFFHRRTAAQQGGDIAERTPRRFVVEIDAAGEQRHVADRAVEGVEAFERQRDKLRFENQILRRVAGDREFRREHQFRAACNGDVVRVEDFVKISAQIADGRVDLGEADLH